jgi:A/G-specific adenine glycosylase
MDPFPYPDPRFTRPVSAGEASEFRRIIYAFYDRHGRSLPWRETRDPYRILVSEMMLQQTQVDRVLGKYGPFLERFPDFPTLARAPAGRVLACWQGLGYNRRCLALHRTARIVTERRGGRLPENEEELLALPGIGTATASAVLSFAFGLPSVFIETNIRNVYIYFFFQAAEGPGGPEDTAFAADASTAEAAAAAPASPAAGPPVADRDLVPLVRATLDRSDPRRWYYALMDYGAVLKRALGRGGSALNRRSRHYALQAPFQGSDRQIRGRILRLLLELPPGEPLSVHTAAGLLEVDRARAQRILAGLERDGFLETVQDGYLLRE